MTSAEPALLDRVRETLEQELRPLVLIHADTGGYKPLNSSCT